jgi:hypothetical protein
MKPFKKIEVQWKSGGTDHPEILLLRQKLEELAGTGVTKAREHLALDNCSYVYWGCGSCGEGSARVDAYCGSGGSQPDFSWCEAC